MDAFRATFRNEIIKLYKKKKAIAAVIISLLVIVAGQLLISGVRYGLGIRGAGSADFPILILSAVINTILPLFTALVAIDSFSGEYAQNSMRVTLTRPVSRIKLFSAKLAAIAAFILAMLLLLLVFSLLAGFIFNDHSATAASVSRTVIAYLISLPPLMGLAAGIVLLANALKNGISVFFLAVLLFIALKMLALFFPHYTALFLTSQLDWYNLFLIDQWPLARILRQILLMTGWGAMLFIVGFYLFDKKEF
ncbi:MAG: ABC transporter permease [Peptococcaceae bacterium]|jgi:ABC-2 type transport system permease protein|nr:ABC transporter permease [Peptococcaceae bacterium]